MGRLGVYMPGSEATAGTLDLSSRTNRPPLFELVGTSIGLGERGTSSPGDLPQGGQFPQSRHPGLTGVRVQQEHNFAYPLSPCLQHTSASLQLMGVGPAH